MLGAYGPVLDYVEAVDAVMAFLEDVRILCKDASVVHEDVLG